MRVLVQPFGYDCEEIEGRRKRADPDCSALDQVLTGCQKYEIFDWTSQRCVSLCGEPLKWVDGKCVLPIVEAPLMSHPNSSLPLNTTGDQNCTQISHSSLRIKIAAKNDYSIMHSGDKLLVTLPNSSESFCVKCLWRVYQLQEFEEIKADSVSNSEGAFMEPFVLLRDNQSVAVCEESDSPEGITLLGEICLRVENLVTVVMLCISIFCLIMMVIVYSILPILHNVPGYIVLSKVSRTNTMHVDDTLIHACSHELMGQ